MVWIAYPFLLIFYGISLYLIHTASWMETTRDAILQIAAAVILHIFLIWVAINA